MEQELRFVAGFGPVWQLLRLVFSCFHGQKNFFKNIVYCENIFEVYGGFIGLNTLKL